MNRLLVKMEDLAKTNQEPTCASAKMVTQDNTAKKVYTEISDQVSCLFGIRGQFCDESAVRASVAASICILPVDHLLIQI